MWTRLSEHFGIQECSLQGERAEGSKEEAGWFKTCRAHRYCMLKIWHQERNFHLVLTTVHTFLPLLPSMSHCCLITGITEMFFVSFCKPKGYGHLFNIWTLPLWASVKLRHADWLHLQRFTWNSRFRFAEGFVLMALIHKQTLHLLVIFLILF